MAADQTVRKHIKIIAHPEKSREYLSPIASFHLT